MYSDGFGKVMILKQACLLFSLSLSQYHSLDLRKAMSHDPKDIIKNALRASLDIR